MVAISNFIHYDALLQNVTAFLLQNVIRVYHKIVQVVYYKLQRFNFKMELLLQNMMICFTKFDNFFKICGSY